jgi:hypothetical protein
MRRPVGRSASVDQLHHALRNAGFVKQLDEAMRAQRAQFGRLDHDAVAHRESGGHFETGGHAWDIPGSEERGDADRFASDSRLDAGRRREACLLFALDQLREIIEPIGGCPRVPPGRAVPQQAGRQAVERSQHVSLRGRTSSATFPQGDRRSPRLLRPMHPASNARLAESTARFTSSGVVS